MKKTIYYFALLALIFGTMACTQDLDSFYKGKSRIQFKYYTLDFNQNKIYKTDKTFSFGMLPEEVSEDTARIVVEFLGEAEPFDRHYRVKVFTDSTTAEVGTHYKVIDEMQTFRAGLLSDTLKVVVYRHALSSSFTDPIDVRLDLELEASEDFDLGMHDGLLTTLYINNYLSEPVWWDHPLRADLGFYHPKKWLILISFNEEFSNPNDCPFTWNNEGRIYFQGLSNYLNAVPTYDDETGDRIYIDRYESQTSN